MRLWRVCRRPFADLSGDGARLHGGRWNSPGRPLVYAAEAAALAVLEVRVHLDLAWDVLPDDYVLVGIDSGKAGIERLSDLPADTVAHGDAWLAEGRSALLMVPSVIVPESCNVLISPAHPEAVQVSVASVRSFAFDECLWLPG